MLCFSDKKSARSRLFIMWMGDTFCVATLYRAFKRVNMGEE